EGLRCSAIFPTRLADVPLLLIIPTLCLPSRGTLAWSCAPSTCWLTGPRTLRRRAHGERFASAFVYHENSHSCGLTRKPATTPLPIRSPLLRSRLSATPGAEPV